MELSILIIDALLYFVGTDYFSNFDTKNQTNEHLKAQA